MRKIPTLFQRSEDRRYVIDAVTPGCEWVLAGEGVATRKYDGTCVRMDEAGQWWARREVKPGKQPPVGFVLVEQDMVTDKRMGWEPAEQSGFARWLAEAIRDDAPYSGWVPGTYELCGPKINGDPEHFTRHVLIRHDHAEAFNLPPVLDYRTIRRAVTDLNEYGHEGIVWHHPDGRMVKIKRRDFPAPATQENTDG